MDSICQVRRGNYTFDPRYCVGQGSFGKVYRGKKVDDDLNREVAIKEIDIKAMADAELNKEIKILQQLKHPNVVTYVDAFAVRAPTQDDDNFYIVTEFCKDGDLRTLMADSDDEDESNDAREKMALKMCQQVVEGFVYLQKSGLIHRDLKPTNILYHEGVFKVADFGLAREESVYRSKL